MIGSSEVSRPVRSEIPSWIQERYQRVNMNEMKENNKYDDMMPHSQTIGETSESRETVEKLVHELKHQLNALDDILSINDLKGLATPEQLQAAKSIAPTIIDLLCCMNQGDLLHVPSYDSSSALSTENFFEAVKNPSRDIALNNVLDQWKPRKRRSTVFIDCEEIECESKLPKDLLMKMMSSTKGKTASGRSSAAFIAQTYGGVQLPQENKRPTLKNMASSLLVSNIFIKDLLRDTFGVSYLPSEFKRLDSEKRLEIARMLSWDSLKVWGFNAFDIDRISSQQMFRYENESLDHSSRMGLEITERGCPVVLIGWAVLASPYAQLAMAENVNDAELIEQAAQIIKQKGKNDFFPIAANLCKEFFEEKYPEEEDGTFDSCANGADLEGYFLLDRFGITPKAIVHFLRKVEKEYPTRDINPYHNNIHASDVIQTTHALIQLGGSDLARAYTCLEIFTILIAAALHDVRHPGTNNNYQVNKQTDLAMVYNDQSVLENMHASVASHLLKESGGSTNKEDCIEGIFGRLSKADQAKVRTGVIRSILSTDMSHHFKSVAKMDRYVGDVLDEINCELAELPGSSAESVLDRIGKNDHAKLRENLLPFILHLADISNPAKPSDISIEWSLSAYDEFFQQGDKEADEGMPISPLCDRSTTSPSDGQVGFITYVVKPAFLVLEQCLPSISSVLTQLEKNLEYWRVRKETKLNILESQEIE